MVNYNPYQQYYPNTYQPQVNNMQMPQVANSTQNQPQIQNGGFIPVPNEDMVHTYPVEMGKCVTFKVEGKPIVLEKIRGFSQFEAPIIKRYRLIEEEKQDDVKEATQENVVLDSVREEIKAIWGEIASLKESKRPIPNKKKEVGDDT